jgi:hypothetical protein
MLEHRIFGANTSDFILYVFAQKLIWKKRGFGKENKKKGSQCCHSRRPSLPRGPVLLRAVGSSGPTLAQPHASLPFPFL